MAKMDKLDFGNIGFDSDLDFKFDDFDFEPKEDKRSKKRQVIEDVATGVGIGVKNHLTDPGTLGKVLRKSLPHGYGAAWKVADAGAETMVSLYDDAVKEIKPGLNNLAKKVDQLIPQNQLKMKKAAAKVKEWTASASSNQQNALKSAEDDGVEQALKSVFSTQFEISEARDVRDKVQDKIREKIEASRFDANISIFSRMDNNIQRLTQYNETVNQAYQKKSLELEFRSYFTMTELLRQVQLGAKSTQAQLTAVIRNTSLPEFAKITESERFKDQAKNRMIAKVQNSLFGDGSRIQKGMQNLKAEGTNLIKGIQQGIEAGLMGAEAFEQMKELQEMEAEMTGKKASKSKMAGQGIGNWLGGRIEDGFAKTIKGRLEKNEKISKMGYKAGKFALNPGGAIDAIQSGQRWQDAEMEGGIKGGAVKGANWLMDMFRSQGPDMKIKGDGGMEGLISPAYSDERARRAQVDIIPGYLARILREVTIQRTGDVGTPLTMFDHQTSRFKTEATLAADLKTRLKTKIREGGYGRSLNEAVDGMVGKDDVTDDERKVLMSVISKLSRLEDFNFSSDNIRKTKIYHGQSKEGKAALEKVLSKMDGEDLSAAKHEMKFGVGIRNVRDNTTDLRGQIEDAIKAGYGEQLAKEGIVKQDENGDYKIDEDAYFKMMESEGMATSDMNVKENISKLNPKEMLKKIRGTKLFNWNYKKGKGPQGKSFDGPMAQDVKSQFGDETAPGGKKIDLVSMNGANMAAIQALADRQDGEMADSATQDLLKLIFGNTSEIVALLKEKGSGGNGGTGSSRASVSDNKYVDGVHNMASTGLGLLLGGASDLAKKGMQGFNWTKNNILVPGGKAIGKFANDNKGNVKDGLQAALGQVMQLTNKALQVGGDLLFNTLPAGFKELGKLGSLLKDKAKSLFNGAKDVYVAGINSPKLQAALMKMGVYRDQVTGKIIKGMDDLKDVKGNIVDHTGQIVLSIEEIAQGIYDSKGESIKTSLGKLFAAGKDILLNAGSRAASLAGAVFSKAKNIPGLSGFGNKIKGAASSAKDSLGNMSLGFADKRSFDVLVQIRDLLAIGKPEDLVKAILDRPLGKPSTSEKAESSGSFMDKLKGYFKGSSGDADSGGGDSGSSETVSAPTMPGVAPAQYQNSGSGAFGAGLMSAAGGLFNKAKGALAPKLDSSPDFVGPKMPGTPGIKGKLGKFGGFLKGKLGAAAGLAKGFFGGDGASGGPAPMVDSEHRPSMFGAAATFGRNVVNSAKKKASHYVEKGKRAFNDKDGNGERDGGYESELDKKADQAQQRQQANAASAAAAAGSTEGIKYRSSENVLDALMKKASGLFDGLGGAASTILSTAGSLLSVKGLKSFGSTILGALKNPMGAVKGIAGAVRGVATGGKLATAGRVAMTVGRVGMLAATGLGGVAMSVGSAALTALGAVFSAPVLLGGAALAAVGFGAYKAYKYFTRDNINAFERIRVMQYGLDGGESTKTFNHLLMNLEGYLLDGKVGYDQGKAYLLDKKIDAKELLDMFSIDVEDTAAAEKFGTWFAKRFKPFFLTHATALFGVDRKVKLPDAPTMDKDKQLKYLSAISFDSGPYTETTSPFKGLDELGKTQTQVKAAIDKEVASLGAAIQSDVLKGKTKTVDNKIVPPVKNLLNVEATQKATPLLDMGAKTLKANGAGVKIPDIIAGGGGEEGQAPKVSAPIGTEIPGVGAAASQLNQAGGPMKDGSGGMQFIKLQPGAKLEGVNPRLLNNFTAMAQEYGETTGKSIIVTNGSRTYEEQAEMYRKNPKKAAKPGMSLHEFGLALDVNSTDLDALDKMGLMRKYGFTRPVGGESWHIEPAGIQGNLAKARQDPGFADMAIRMSLNRGGGGVGSIRGTPLGKRDQQMAASLFGEGASVKTVDLEKMKDTSVKATDSLSANETIVTDKPGAANQSTIGTANLTPSKDPGTKDVAGNTVTKDDGVTTTTGTKAANRDDWAKRTDGGGQDVAQKDPKYASNFKQIGEVSERTKDAEGESKPSVPSTGSSAGGGEAPQGREAVKAAIGKYAAEAGQDPAMMQTFAAVESGMNPNAKAGTSSADGPFQFTKTTWKEQLQKNGQKRNVDMDTPPSDVRGSTLLASDYMKQNAKSISSVKPNPNMTDMYLTHFLGAGGARKFLSASPDEIGAKVLPSAAEANKGIFYANGKPLTIGEIYKNLTEKLQKRAKEYGINLGNIDTSMGQTKAAANDSKLKGPVPISDNSGVGGATRILPEKSTAPKGSENVPVEAPVKAKTASPFMPTSGNTPDQAVMARQTKNPGEAVYSSMSGIADSMSEQLKVAKSIDSTLTGMATTMTKVLESIQGFGNAVSASKSPAPGAAPAPQSTRPSSTSVVDLSRKVA